MKKIDFKRVIASLCVLVLIFSIFLQVFARVETDNKQDLISLTDEEKDYIEKNPEISIAIDTSWMPYGFLNKDKECDGIIPNIMNIVSSRVGMKVNYVSKPSYAEAILACNSGETMLVSGIANDKEIADKNNVLITNPYITIGYSAVTKRKISDLYSDGSKYKVALCKGTYAKIAMQNRMATYEFEDLTSNQECMDAVLNDKADIALIADYSAGYFKSWHEYSDLQTIQINDFSWKLCFGVNENCDERVISIMNKGVDSLTENDVNQAIYSGAIEASSSTNRLSDFLYKQPILVSTLVSLIVAAMLLIVFLTVIQRRKNAERAKQLQYEKEIYSYEQQVHLKTEEALKQAKQASASKTEFFSRMSHDMRTPMNGILGMVDLSEDEQDITVLKENMTKIKSSGEYLLGLINDTLDFQKIESGKLVLEPNIVYFKELLDSITGMIKSSAEKKKVNFKVLYKNGVEKESYIKIDPLRMKQVFINLLSNAIKFTPEGGTVELEIKLLSREGNISHNEITVADTGIGMSNEFLMNGIFKPFSQEKNEYSMKYAGTGLGLSIAKKLIELMGGSITVESELGAGTKFRINLDFIKVDKKEYNKTVNEDEKRKKDAIESLRGKKILLAEDHPLNAEIAIKLLNKAGCIVDWAEDGQKCIDMLKNTEDGYYNVILMDIRMPIVDGIEATKCIRELDREDAKQIAIVAMTANAYAEDIKKCIDAGMNAHIAKPVQPRCMYETIAEVL